MEVWHFILDHRTGGPHAYVAALRSGLRDQVATVIVTTDTGPLTDVRLVNLRHIWASLYGAEIAINVLSIVWKILRSSVRRDGLIFNVHGGANIAPIAAARLLGIPVVWHLHETLASLRWLVSMGRRLLTGHPHRLVSVSAAGIHLLNLRSATLVPAPVDTSFWSKDRVSREAERWPWGHDRDMNGIRRLRVLMVGNLNPLKGADILLEALSKVPAPWHLKIAGAELATHREYSRRLMQRAIEITSNIDAKIDFLGWQDSEAVRSLMASCHIFVLPSRSEACPIALLEAMSMGAICIASNVGDVAVILSQGHLGTLVTAEDPEQLAIALSEGRDLPEDFVKCRSSASRQRAINDFSIEKIAASMLGVYRSLISVP